MQYEISHLIHVDGFKWWGDREEAKPVAVRRHVRPFLTANTTSDPVAVRTGLTRKGMQTTVKGVGEQERLWLWFNAKAFEMKFLERLNCV